MSSSRLAHGILGRTNTALPVASTPCTAKTFLARSIPMVTMAVMTPPFHKTSESMKNSTFPSWHSVAENREPHGVRLVRDGEVPFIR